MARSTAIVACWGRYAEGIDENGDPIDVQDPLRDELVARAGQQYENPLAFIQNEWIFDAPPRNPEFTEHYRRTVESLSKKGMRRTIRDLNEPLAAVR